LSNPRRASRLRCGISLTSNPGSVHRAPINRRGGYRELSRDIANAVRSAPSLPAEDYNRLLEQQLAEAGSRGGQIDYAELLTVISRHYDRIDAERRGIVRS